MFMASKADKNDRAKVLPTKATTSKLRPSSRRSNSFSSNSSQCSEDSPIFSPATPLRSFSGIPFSWEKLPGIPKGQSSKKMMTLNPSSMNLLPLPPSGTNSKQAILKRFSTSESFKKDPFFAALAECSKDEQDAMANYWKGSKATMRSNVSNRFGLGFISIYTSCKRTCAISESIVYLPRSESIVYLPRSNAHYSYNRH